MTEPTCPHLTDRVRVICRKLALWDDGELLEDDAGDRFYFGVCYGLASALHALGAGEQADIKDFHRRLEPPRLAAAYTEYVVRKRGE